MGKILFLFRECIKFLFRQRFKIVFYYNFTSLESSISKNSFLELSYFRFFNNNIIHDWFILSVDA